MNPLTQRFVQHFGEMGSRWGINRTVAQIWALLYVAEQPLHGDEIAASLGFSRSNISMGLKELESWNLVRLQHVRNDRREYYSTATDVWTIFRTLLAERRKREIDPTLSMLRDTLLDQPEDPADAHAQRRLREMHDLLELAGKWFDAVQGLESKTLAQLMRMGARVQHLVRVKRRLSAVAGGRGKA